MTDTLKRGPGRPKGSTTDDADSQIDALIMRRQEAEEQNREEADRKARYVLRQYNERAARRQEWLDYHHLQAHRHLALAREHFAEKTRLAREEIA